MSPEIENITVRIKADTRAFNRSLRRVQWSLWIFQWGPWFALAGTFLLGLAIGAVIGVVTS